MKGGLLMAIDLELGLDTFGDLTSGADGAPLSHAQVIRNLIDEAVLADSLDIDFFGLGEHHRADFAVSSPEVVLAAIAARTKRIRLGSAVTVLSSDDPIRVFQRFATLDAVSRGRAEVILGRGSFTESFPLFGYKLDQYEQLFEEKLDLFAALIGQQPVTWQGTLRPPLNQQRVFPPIETGSLKAWIGVGGSPESVVRAARYGMPLMLAIIGGEPSRFRPYVDLYHRALGQLGKPVLPIGVHSPGHVADSDQQAREELWPDYKGHRAVRPEIRRRCAVPRKTDAQHRPLWQRSNPKGAKIPERGRAGGAVCPAGSDLMDAIYRVDGSCVTASPNAAGPWDAGMLQGSGPAGLVVWAAEAIPRPRTMGTAK
jgi:probable LLM family oxidoreductase